MSTLYKHQEAGVELALKTGSCALFMDPGTGKTLTALTIYDRLHAQDQNLALMVFCPLSLIEAAWRGDLEKFFPKKYSFLNAHDKGLVHGPAIDIVALNYEFLVRANKVARLKEFFKDSNRPWMAVLDESSKMKNNKSATTKALLELRSWFHHRIIMSGTPAPNSEMEYWAQISFIKPFVFPARFSQFKNRFFHLEARGKRIETQGTIMTRAAMMELYKRGAEYKITPERRELLFSLMSPFIHSAKKEECLDLPEQIDELRLVDMTAAQKKAYNEMKRALITEINEKYIVAQVALTKVMKLREITSGFAMDGDSIAIAIPGNNPKLEALEELLDELGDRQAIIWCQFKWEIEQIVALLLNRGKAKPFLFGTLYSETGGDRDEIIRSFISGGLQYLIAHPASAAHGLTFVNCSHQIFFSLDYSWERYEQARARTHRAGQKSTCVYYHLMAKDTIDVEILAALRDKRDMQGVVFSLGEKT